MRKPTKKFNDPTTAKKLITVLNRLMGLRPFHDQKGQPRIFLSSPYVVVLWSLLSGSALFLDRYRSSNQTLEMYLNRFYFYLYIPNSACLTFLGYYYSKTFVLYEKKMLKVDESLRKLGISPEYRGSVAISMILIIAWFTEMVLTFLLSLSTTAALVGVPIALYVNSFGSYVMNIGTFVLLDFVVCVRSVKERFGKVNDLLANYATDGLQIHAKKNPPRVLLPEISLRSNNWIRSRSKLTPLERLLHTEEQREHTEGRNWRLQVIRQVHLELCRASDLLSEIFGAQVALEIRLSLITITITLYYIYISMKQPRFAMAFLPSNIPLGISCIIDFVKLFLLSRACEHACREASKALTIVHSCYPSVIDSGTKNEIRQFAIQLSHCHQGYTKRYISRLNYTLLSACISAITTNLVVMVQMGQSLVLEYSPTVDNNSIADASVGP